MNIPSMHLRAKVQRKDENPNHALKSNNLCPILVKNHKTKYNNRVAAGYPVRVGVGLNVVPYANRKGCQPLAVAASLRLASLEKRTTELQRHQALIVKTYGNQFSKNLGAVDPTRFLKKARQRL